MERKRFVVLIAVFSILASPAFASAAEKGHEGMSGVHGDHGTMKPGGHDMTTMGEKVFSGKIGPWEGTARIIDMKAQMGAAGMKAQGAMPNSHHIAFELTDPNTKKAVTEGTGKVTVTGPDKKETKAGFMVMEGHFGTDVNLPAPGTYTFQAEIESGVQKGSATFSYTVK